MNEIQFGFPERDKIFNCRYWLSNIYCRGDGGSGMGVQIRWFQIFQIFSNIMELNSKNIQFLCHVKCKSSLLFHGDGFIVHHWWLLPAVFFQIFVIEGKHKFSRIFLQQSFTNQNRRWKTNDVIKFNNHVLRSKRQ